ncbi:MAG: hypothetical protein WCK95_08555 [Alphaproteobacteria bacterium]|jgi:hypothetical protein
MRSARAIVCILALLPTAALADARDDLAGAARAFDEAALRLSDDNAKPTSVHKWMAPIRLSFDNPGAAPNLVELTRRSVKAIAAEAGVVVVDLETRDTTANFIVYFDENGTNGKSGYCFAQSWWKSWALSHGELRVNPTRIRDIDRCATHESLHAFGFNSHPHAADSVLSYTYHGRRTLSPLDVNLIHTLYDARLTPGLKPAPASQLACRILGERMGSSPSDIDAVCRDRKGPPS